MGPWAWLIILAWSAALATAANYAYFARHAAKTDYDWTFIAGGAILGAFTAHVWYPITGLPVVDGLNLLQALGGGIVGGLLVEAIYRFFIRPRQGTSTPVQRS
jgi:hypothetical protein